MLGAEDYLAGSKLERAKQYISKNCIEPSSVLVVGDLLHDYEMAQSVGADCVCCWVGDITVCKSSVAVGPRLSRQSVKSWTSSNSIK